MTRYFINKDKQIASYTRQDLIDKCLTEGITYDEQGNIIEKATWQEITETEYQTLTQEPQISQAEMDRQNKIQELKNNLSQTDYQAIKYAEGQITAEEYEPIKQQRQEWRNQINKLEVENG